MSWGYFWWLYHSEVQGSKKKKINTRPLERWSLDVYESKLTVVLEYKWYFVQIMSQSHADVLVFLKHIGVSVGDAAKLISPMEEEI